MAASDAFYCNQLAEFAGKDERASVDGRIGFSHGGEVYAMMGDFDGRDEAKEFQETLNEWFEARESAQSGTDPPHVKGDYKS